MPLQKGSSRAVISSNIGELVRAGHSQSQAAAIAYKEAGEDCTLTEDECRTIARAMGAQDALVIALDRSVRTFDADGRLHVAIANISRACVNPYYGREIPGSEALGLKPDQVYQLFRDPEALKLGAATFNNLPLMDEHIIVSAENPEKDRVVGSTGTDAAFDGEFLTNSLVIWDADCIARIESGEQKEISCAYRYVPINRPGSYKGQKYDLAMSALVGNHVALVPAGRAGPDVVVGDSLENASMPLSRTAIMVKGALRVLAKPVLAADASVDFDTILAGVTAKNFDGAGILSRFKTASKGKLAADASLEPIRMALDAMEEEAEDSDDETDEERKERESREARDKKAAKDAKRAKDEESEEEEEESAEDAEEDDEDRDKARDASGYEAMDAKGKKAWDAGWINDRKARDAKRAKDRRAKDKKAMDARIDAVRRDTIAQMNAIATAKTEVEQFVGVITAAMDSAEDVYKFALDQAGVDTKDVPPAAYAAMVKMLPTMNAPTPRIALDAARTTAGNVRQMFPQLARIRQG